MCLAELCAYYMYLKTSLIEKKFTVLKITHEAEFRKFFLWHDIYMEGHDMAGYQHEKLYPAHFCKSAPTTIVIFYIIWSNDPA